MYLGIDFGMKRVGLAVAPEGGPAAPLSVIEWGKGTPILDLPVLVRVILEVAKQEGATAIIVGSPSRQSLALTDPQERWRKQIEEFLATLRSATKIPIVTEDERMSTKLAERLTGYKGIAEQDAVAAAVILDGYIERSKVRLDERTAA